MKQRNTLVFHTFVLRNVTEVEEPEKTKVFTQKTKVRGSLTS